MAKNKRFSGKLAVGIFVDGVSLQVACLAKVGKKKLNSLMRKLLILRANLRQLSLEHKFLRKRSRHPHLINPQ
jgi:hypothetical protein